MATAKIEKELRGHRVNREVAFKRLHEMAQAAKRAIQLPTAEEKANFESRVTLLERTYDQFENMHSGVLKCLTLMNAVAGDELVHEDEIRQQVDNLYAEVKKTQQHFSVKVEPQSVVIKKSNVKLPVITLPRFDGDYKSWPSFIELFNALVHTNENISKVEKFQYLSTSLAAEPMALIKTIPLMEANYQIAYDILEKRYQNKRILATNCWSAINNAPQLSRESFKQIKSLLNVFSENIALLRTLNLPVQHWDFVLFNLLINKLDSHTRKYFELQHSDTTIPTYVQLTEFLEKHAHALEAAQSVYEKQKAVVSTDTKHVKCFNQNLVVEPKCPLCSEPHFMFNCTSFLNKDPEGRFSLCKKHSICLNCLKGTHRVKDCPSNFTCRKCKAKHNTLLHFGKSQKSNVNVPQKSSQEESVAIPSPDSNINPINVLAQLANPTMVLLATACVEIKNRFGNFSKIRVLLDSASQANFISEKLFRGLGLKRKPYVTPIQGVASLPPCTSNGITNCKIQSLDKQSSFSLPAIILSNICTNQPAQSFAVSNWQHISNLALADPDFNKSGPVDMLLGADIFAQIIRNGRLTGQAGEPVALNTTLGWILMGLTSCKSSSSVATSCCLTSIESIEETLKSFWELEEVPTATKLSPEDIECETHFAMTHYRTDSGHYVVSLPFKTINPQFPNSRSIVLRRFFSLEQRLLRDSSLKELYHEFMRDYLVTGHMSLAPRVDAEEGAYLPHHPVLRPDSSTTKLRVVFDASAKCSNDLSLNDTLLVGPKLQKDIVSILLNFRLHRFAFTADVKQMYRQIVVTPQDRKFQKIVSRFSAEEPVRDYILNTVTYGTSSAPFLALRTLKQLASDERDRFPRAAEMVDSDIYVDDLVSGSSSLDEALALQKEVIELFAAGKFELRKWSSNCPQLLEAIPKANVQQLPLSFDSGNSTIKILGLQWVPDSDTFVFEIKPLDRRCTKRNILSDVARIFDPLGFLSPLTFFLKSLIQRLWQLKLEWDDPAPTVVADSWFKYSSELGSLVNLSVPRHINSMNTGLSQLHGFCDASEKGYAAVIYIRLIQNNHPRTYLVCAKSKVAPLKTLTVPRLELSGALLLAKLFKFVLATYADTLSFDKIFAWSDSTFFYWLKSPHKWKTFVANRIAQILQHTPNAIWRYVPSAHNPADCASRGVLPSEMLTHQLWWTGPLWLLESEEDWPPNSVPSLDKVPTEELSKGSQLLLVATTPEHTLDGLLERVSSLSKIQRILAYCRRFIKIKLKIPDSPIGILTHAELTEALMILVKHVQETVFNDEIHKVFRQQACPKPMQKLNPFIDDGGILRVGGRLVNAKIGYEHKHPALLPQRHRLTTLIINQIHWDNFHPGSQTLQYLLCQQFWILSVRRAIRHALRCHRCFRAKPPRLIPLMGDLPMDRISKIKPFSIVGVDFAGPFMVTYGKARGAKSHKAYLCLFVCLATKALHLELASDLSTDAFLAALRRFIARRGRCSKIYSDCGTNFKGAAKYLSSIFKTATDIEHISWHFNPPLGSAFRRDLGSGSKIGQRTSHSDHWGSDSHI